MDGDGQCNKDSHLKKALLLNANTFLGLILLAHQFDSGVLVWVSTRWNNGIDQRHQDHSAD